MKATGIAKTDEALVRKISGPLSVSRRAFATSATLDAPAPPACCRAANGIRQPVLPSLARQTDRVTGLTFQTARAS